MGGDFGCWIFNFGLDGGRIDCADARGALLRSVSVNLAELRRAPEAGGWECRPSEKGGVIARIEILQWSGLSNG